MPGLQVKAGPSLEQLKPASVNDEIGVPIESDYFHGKLILRVRHYKGADGQVIPDTANNYFTQHKNATWSIQLQGKFKHDVDLDDLMFGNVWDHPIRDRLPYGTGVALRFLHWFDPGLELDLQADDPWALSPLISTMQNVRIAPNDRAIDEKKTNVVEDVMPLFSASDKEIPAIKHLENNPEARRKYFANPQHRKGREIPKNVAIQADFRNGLIDLEDGVFLKIPVGGFKVDLMRIWDGKARRFCTKQATVRQEREAHMPR